MIAVIIPLVIDPSCSTVEPWRQAFWITCWIDFECAPALAFEDEKRGGFGPQAPTRKSAGACSVEWLWFQNVQIVNELTSSFFLSNVDYIILFAFICCIYFTLYITEWWFILFSPLRTVFASLGLDPTDSLSETLIRLSQQFSRGSLELKCGDPNMFQKFGTVGTGRVKLNSSCSACFQTLW